MSKYIDFYNIMMIEMRKLDVPDCGDEPTIETISIKTGVLRDWGYTGWWDDSKHRPNNKARSYAKNKDRR